VKRFAESEAIVRRLNSEIEFSQGLAERLQEKSWGPLIEKAGSMLDAAAASESLPTLQETMREIEALLAPIGAVAKTYTCHCVGHGHMDMNWMWNWPETVSATNDMFITVLKLMEEFPGFCFSQSQVSVYEIVRKYNPDLFEQIKARVAEGRWEVTASEWVEGDKNLASGESLTRHLLYSRRYMAEHFGLRPEEVSVAWNPDTFGHALTIPMIYSRGGVSQYYMCRGGETERPPIFWWRSPDGSRLLVNLEHTWYNDVLGPHNVKGLLSFNEQTGLKDWMLVYGVGDHGGGPTRRDLRLCQEMDTWPIYPNFKFSTTRDYYQLLEQNSDDLPEVSGELNYEFTGCYTSQSDIKKTNRLAECALERAEAASVLAYTALGMDYPHDPLRQAWTDTLLGHFHDILPGSGVKATREYHSGQYQNTTATTGMITTRSLRAIAAQIDTSFAGESEAAKDDLHFGAGMGLGLAHKGGVSSACHGSGDKRGFVVFNPTASPRTEVITLTAWDAENDNVQTKCFAVRLPDGREIPAQRLDAGESWFHRYVNLAVPVSVAAMSYIPLVLIEKGENDPVVRNSFGYPDLKDYGADCGVENMSRPRPLFGYCMGERGMENSFVRVRFDERTGGIIELTDKATGKNLVSSDQPAAVLEYILERPGTMSSWLIHPSRKRRSPLDIVDFKPVIYGPHIAAYELTCRINESTVKVSYLLQADSPKLEIAIEVNWLERGGPDTGTPTLRIRFPFALEDAAGRYEAPFGSVERKPDPDQEVPSLRWVDVAGRSADGSIAGCTVLNDCKYGYCLDESTLTATLIRSSYEPDPLPEMGKSEMKFAVVPHGGPAATGELIQAGAEFNQLLQVVGTDIHAGTLPAAAGDVIASDRPNVMITGVKKAEDEDALIVRLLETAGETTAVNVTVDSVLIGEVCEVKEVDLLERELSSSTAQAVADGFRVEIPGGTVSSVKLKLK
jgi:alpha-mannosidase